MRLSHYRIVRAIPARLDYASASYALEIVRQQHETLGIDEWVLRARKLDPQGTVCVLVSAIPARSRLEQRLIDGFDVEHAAPAGRIMARLARDGVALEMGYRRGS